MSAARAALFAILIISCCVLQCHTFATDLKCCPDGEVLVLNDAKSVTCEESFVNCTVGQFCVDADGDGGIYKVFCKGGYEKIAFSKCCPYNMSYSAKNHSCENAYQSGGDFVGVNKKIGLPQCSENKVIVDYISEGLPDVVNGGVELNGTKFVVDQFCLDSDVSTGKYVMRVCVDNKICGNGVSCVRKCCPDGYHYGINRTCDPFFENGVNWHTLPDNFQQRKGIIFRTFQSKIVNFNDDITCNISTVKSDLVWDLLEFPDCYRSI